MTRRLAPAAGVAAVLALLCGSPVAAGQEPPAPAPEAAPAPPPPLAAPRAPRAVAVGGRLAVRLEGLGPGAAGIDVVNLANNHVGDYGDRALLDTLRTSRAAGMTAVGAGANEAAAYRPQIVERLGLRVAFVGFSVILPFEFRAFGASPGTAWAFPERVTRGIRRARRDADVVVAMFHWGTERAGTENPQQRALAGVALAAGADAVLGAHPHVLQPIRRPPGRVVAYSLGNFVFNANSAGTASTGILRLGLGRRDVRAVRLIRATIRATRPVLR